MRSLLPPLLAACALAWGVALAAGALAAPDARGRVDVVATTTEVTGIVRAVAGRRAAVHGLLAPNADPHEYELRPRDARALARAGLVLRSGGDVDAWLADAVDAAGTRAPQVTLLDHVRPLRRGDEIDP